jgi:type II secretory pathway pseudopilin PulG
MTPLLSKRQLPAAGRRLRSRRGYTLVEMMVAGGCAAVVLAGILTGYTYLLRAFAAVTNYVDIHQQAGNAVAVFSKDMREVNRVSTNWTSSYLQVTVPTNINSSGGISGVRTVTYSYANSALYRTDSTTGVQKLQATNVYNLVFTLFGTNGVALATNTTTFARGVQMDLYLRKYVGSQGNSEEFRSARVCMRNVP